jgi:hypothetical protein
VSHTCWSERQGLANLATLPRAVRVGAQRVVCNATCVALNRPFESQQAVFRHGWLRYAGARACDSNREGNSVSVNEPLCNSARAAPATTESRTKASHPTRPLTGSPLLLYFSRLFLYISKHRPSGCHHHRLLLLRTVKKSCEGTGACMLYQVTSTVLAHPNATQPPPAGGQLHLPCLDLQGKVGYCAWRFIVP